MKTKELGRDTPIAVSPDGKLVAYVVVDTGRIDRPYRQSRDFTDSGVWLFNEYATDIYVTNTVTGETENITGARGSNWSPSWSPGGTLLGFLSDRGGEAQLWVWDRSKNTIRRVSAAPVMPPPQRNLLCWLDDGKEVLIPLLPRGISYADEERRLVGPARGTRLFARGSSAIEFSNKGGQVSLPAATRQLEGYDGQSSSALFDLGTIDIATGSTRVIRTSMQWSAFRGGFGGVSADGRYALFVRDAGADKGLDSTVFDITAVDVESGRAWTLRNIPLFQFGLPVSWAPQGHTFAFIEGSFFQHVEVPQPKRGQVFIAEPGVEPAMVSSGSHPVFGNGLLGGAPVWSHNGNHLFVVGAGELWEIDVKTHKAKEITHSAGDLKEILATNRGTIAWQPTGSRFIYVRAGTSRETIDVVNRATGQMRALQRTRLAYAASQLSDPAGPSQWFDASQDSGIAVFAAGASTHPPDLFVTRDFAVVRRVTDLNPLFDRYVLGATEQIQWRDSRDALHRGALMLPSDYRKGERYPLIVWQYPGLTGSDAVNVFGFIDPDDSNLQVFATRGYAVLFPDVPAVRTGKVMETERDVILSGIDYLVGIGVVDPRRLGIMGGSYGGYSTLEMLTGTHRFSAAIDMDGVADWVSAFGMLLDNGDAFRVQEEIGEFGGAPWDKPRSYVSASPVFHLNKIKTPLLIIHGRDNDYLVPATLGDAAVFVGLRHLNRAVTYVTYDAGHLILSMTYADRIDCMTRMVRWFDRFLKVGSN